MSKSPEVLKSLKKAFIKFEEACTFPDEEVYRDAALKRFEFTFELCWKLMAAMLEDIGNEAFGVKRVFRVALSIGLIDDYDCWADFCELRNESAHVYNEGQARAILARVTIDFRAETAKLIAKATEIQADL